jgi:Domain of unknown function (DUF4350)
MRKNLGVVLIGLVVVGVLAALNAIPYARPEVTPDSEVQPDRSTYHSGPTGTRALYDFLSESGYRVMRWRELPSQLLGARGQAVRTFVLVGGSRVRFNENELRNLMWWVRRGGRLVIIDRLPPAHLLQTLDDWRIATKVDVYPWANLNPADVAEMTHGIEPVRPVQPTPLTRDVDLVQPSRFAADITLFTATPPSPEHEIASDEQDDEDDFPQESPPDHASGHTALSDHFAGAPVVHVADAHGSLLVNYPYGDGEVVLLSDPFMVSNAGLKVADNLQLALNLVGSPQELIAFDEYHLGHGLSGNPLLSYFSGTPVLAVCFQLLLLILAVIWTRMRRFARPLPLPTIDRRSRLEFVASMAEVQQGARAFDLAIENIYARTRRALARYAGVAYNSPRRVIATRVAERSHLEGAELELLMRQCEDKINGEPVNGRQALDLVRRLRQTERALGLTMRSREIRQAAERI